MNKLKLFTIIILACLPLLFVTQLHAQVQPKDTVSNNKSVSNTFWKGDSVYIGGLGTRTKPVWVHISNDSATDTLGFCWENDTTLSVRHAWGILNPGEWYNSDAPVSYKFLRRAVFTSSDTVKSRVTSLQPTP